MNYKLGIIGCGVMANAIVSGIKDTAMICYDLDTTKAVALSASTGASVANSIQEVLDSSEIVLLAVKPQHSAEIFTNYDFSKVKTLISIMAGVKIAKIKKQVNNKRIGVVRVMPNLPIRVKKGVAALAFTKNVKPAHKEFALRVFNSSGIAYELDEKLFDAVTGVSGSGPAYVYMFIEGLTSGGIEMGLPADIARLFAEETVIGAATYARDTDSTLSNMVEAVCSKGGTTIEAVDFFRKKNLEKTIAIGVKKATLKSKKLSK